MIKKYKGKILKESLIGFTQDSDPIDDMGIGIGHKYNEFLNDIFKKMPYRYHALMALRLTEPPPYIKSNLKEIEYVIQLGGKDKKEFIKYALYKYNIPISADNEFLLRTAAYYDEFKLGKWMVNMGANIDDALNYAKRNMITRKVEENLDIIKKYIK